MGYSSTDKERLKPTRGFFDFYSLNLLNYFAGENSLNFENRRKRINKEYENVVENFYKDILIALAYSVQREFRHYNTQANGREKELIKLSAKCKKGLPLLEKQLQEHDLSIIPDKEILRKILRGFESGNWCSSYGGKPWAEGARFLVNLPKTFDEKVIWIDRVLDLQHNNGHMLNKTKFRSLSEYNYCFKSNPLDYRKKAKTFSSLLQFSSLKVKSLGMASKNFIPEKIR